MKKSELKVVAVIFLIIALLLIWAVVWKQGKKEEIKNVVKNEEKNVVKQNVIAVENNTNEEFVAIKQDGTKVNTSNKLKENKTFNGLEIKNITIETKSNETIVKAIIKNTTNTTKGEHSIKLKIKDKQGNVVKEVYGYINSIEPQMQTTLNIKTSYDFANAYDFEIEKY